MPTPLNLIHIALAERDPRMLTSPDGQNVQVSLEAIRAIVDDPPPVLGIDRRGKEDGQ